MRSFIKRLLGPKILRLFRTYFPSEIQRKGDLEDLKDSKIRAKFYGTFINKGDLCFDVGANFGNRVRPLLDLGAEVVAVEPQEVCYTFLKNKFGKKIKLVTKGLGENETVKKFYLSNGTVLSSFSEEWIDSVKTTRFQDYSWNESVDVELTTVDKLIETFGLPAFLKIDVEGYELEVLKGLTHPIKMISFEYTVPEQAQRPIQCIDQIQAHNKSIECNYCIGENMFFAMEAWLSVEEMKTVITSEEFLRTSGDIYVRTRL